MADHVCGYIYTHASGYQERCTRLLSEHPYPGHGDWQPVAAQDTWTPRASRIRTAMIIIDARGEKPTVGRVQAELGEFVSHDMNGRDVATHTLVMEELGYVSTRVGFGNRWVKVDGD